MKSFLCKVQLNRSKVYIKLKERMRMERTKKISTDFFCQLVEMKNNGMLENCVADKLKELLSENDTTTKQGRSIAFDDIYDIIYEVSHKSFVKGFVMSAAIYNND